MTEIEVILQSYLERNSEYNFTQWKYEISNQSVLRSWGGVVFLNHPTDRMTGEKVELFGFKPLLIDVYDMSVMPVLKWPWVYIENLLDEYALGKGYPEEE